MPRLDDLALFSVIAEAGSLSAAARLTGRPKSGLSKRMAALEGAMGAKLLHRTARNVVPTDLGREVLVHARGLLVEGEAAMDVVARRVSAPAGPVTITASVPGAQWHLAPLLPGIARALPAVELRIRVTDQFVDLVQEKVDIALRSHAAPLPDSELIGREFARAPITLVAAPAYLELRGYPKTVEALVDHDAILPAPDSVLSLSAATRQLVRVKPRVRMVADESQVIIAACLAGLGIAALPDWMTEALREEGLLTAILPEWSAGEVRTTLLTTARRDLLPSVRAVIDGLLAARGQTRPGLLSGV